MSQCVTKVTVPKATTYRVSVTFLMLGHKLRQFPRSLYHSKCQIVICGKERQRFKLKNVVEQQHVRIFHPPSPSWPAWPD